MKGRPGACMIFNWLRLPFDRGNWVFQKDDFPRGAWRLLTNLWQIFASVHDPQMHGFGCKTRSAGLEAGAPIGSTVFKPANRPVKHPARI